MARGARVRAAEVIRRWTPEQGDAALYGASGAFAGLTLAFSNIALYRQWGALALGPYLAAAALSLAAWRWRVRAAARADGDATGAGDDIEEGDADPAEGADRGPRRYWSTARIWIFVGILLGATLLPLSLEVYWRGSGGNPSAHVQPEVVVVEQAGHRAAKGQDPYRTVVRRGRVVVTTPGEPTYESFFPYGPLMSVFGLPSSTKAPIRVTDARIFFSLVTLLVTAVALVLLRGPPEPKVRTLQVLTVLPTAALPLATGGDDMPVAAFLLLAMVLAQRRRPAAAGLVLGAAAAMKFTAWPLALLALFAARDAEGRRRPGRMAVGMAVVVVPAVVPFLVTNPTAFFQNVFLYPLGLSGVSSPAASALPGHLLVSAFPALHRVLPLTVAVVGGAVLARYLWRHPPTGAAEVCRVAGWVMLVAVLAAPATRIGYLLYPVNFFVWSVLFRRADARVAEPVG